MSQRRPSFARFIGAVLMAVMAFVVVAPAALAASPEDVCTDFPHRQTYTSEGGLFRAPAWHFKKTVTIVYEAETCEATPGESDDYVLAIAGTATVYEGARAKGEPLKKRPFTSTITSSDTDGNLGWPVPWWTCFEGSFSYVWAIEDVYVFSVTAENGRWVMAQRDPRSGDGFAQVANGCFRRR
jgi:hypothetical protein